jgi:hypothetical protein
MMADFVLVASRLTAAELQDAVLCEQIFAAEPPRSYGTIGWLERMSLRRSFSADLTSFTFLFAAAFELGLAGS